MHECFWGFECERPRSPFGEIAILNRVSILLTSTFILSFSNAQNWDAAMTNDVVCDLILPKLLVFRGVDILSAQIEQARCPLHGKSLKDAHRVND